jgi:hypothetical protein
MFFQHPLFVIKYDQVYRASLKIDGHLVGSNSYLLNVINQILVSGPQYYQPFWKRNITFKSYQL